MAPVDAGWAGARKLRVRAIHESRAPAAHIQVELGFLEPAPRPKERESFTALRTLTTSRDGFAIFSLHTLPISQKSTGQLSVRFAGSAEHTFAVAPGVGAYTEHTLPVFVKEKTGKTEYPGPWLDDGLEPDDVWAFPGLFSDLTDLEFGNDYCGRLVPKDPLVRVFRREHVVRTGKNVVECLDHNIADNIDDTVKAGDGKGGGPIDDTVKPGDGKGGGPIDDTVKAGDGKGKGAPPKGGDTGAPSKGGDAAAEPRRISLHEGTLMRCEVKWMRLGYTFGDLLYSVPLAPCESVSIGISHWTQRQAARTEQLTESQESKRASSAHTGFSSDALHATTSQLDLSVAQSLAAGGSHGHAGTGMIWTWAMKAAGAVAVTYGQSLTASFDLKDFASQATHTFADSIEQSAEGWRRDHQVLVMEQTESEDQYVSYRTLCNNNHCHVLNIFYHEVLNNFRVSTRFVGSQEVYFVPYEVRHFTAARALCARPVLLPFLLDSALAECFDDTKWQAAGPSAGDGKISAGDGKGGATKVDDGAPEKGSTKATEAGGDCLARLLAHLNCNKLYYNSILWLTENPNERFERFDQIECPKLGGSLADVLALEPVAVMGHYVAFPKAASKFVAYDGRPIGDERIVSLPTAGIFADAALGQCNTCEKIDEGVYWDWSKTPCTCCGKEPTLTAPLANSLLNPAGPLAVPTTVLASFPTLSSGDGNMTNSLVTTFGAALATALLSNAQHDDLAKLKDLMDKITEMLKNITPTPPDMPTKDTKDTKKE